MIKYTDIHAEQTNPKLTSKEMKILQDIEKMTDEAIENQFPKNFVINIDAIILDNKASVNGIYRRIVIINAWQKMYEEAGWRIKYSCSSTYPTWDFTKINS